MGRKLGTVGLTPIGYVRNKRRGTGKTPRNAGEPAGEVCNEKAALENKSKDKVRTKNEEKYNTKINFEQGVYEKQSPMLTQNKVSEHKMTRRKLHLP